MLIMLQCFLFCHFTPCLTPAAGLSLAEQLGLVACHAVDELTNTLDRRSNGLVFSELQSQVCCGHLLGLVIGHGSAVQTSKDTN